MAILEATSTESRTGFRKRIDEESESVILNIVQVALYQFPFKSMIREILSNAVDSNREKSTARLIKTGSAKVSDFYVESTGDLYKDSKFDPDYYDLSFLSPSDEVNIDYIVNPDYSGRDLLTVKDNGVGLGGYRLEKFFSPGASTKRLNKQALGKYGIGNKSPLSTGIGVYRLISQYNGKQFIFDIREDKIDSLVPKFNEAGEENPFITFENTVDMKGHPMKVYYIPTDSKNSVEIQVEIKKHNKSSLFEGVKSQLMYFKDDIIFTEHNGSNKNVIDFKTRIVYEDNDLIVPATNSYYQRPHFILNNVCYGLIDFRELELDTRYGNIGIKVDPSEIDVSPSRESVTYSQKTKDTVLKKYEEIVNRVTNLVDKELSAEDPIEWLRRVNSIVLYSNNRSSDDLLGRLSGLIDKAQIKPVYTKNNVIFKYQQDAKSMTTKHLPIDSVHLAGYGSSKSVKRTAADNALIFDKDLYVQFANASSTKTAYLLSTIGTFSLMKLDYPDEIKEGVIEFLTGVKTLEETKALSLSDAFKEDSDKSRFLKSINFLEFIRKSDKFKVYDDVVVPDDFENELRKNPDAVVLEVTPAEKAKMRKSAGVITFGQINKESYSQCVITNSQSSMEAFPENIWYGFGTERDHLIITAKHMNADVGKNPNSFSDMNLSRVDTDTIIIRIAQSLKAKFKSHNHISTYGYDVEDGVFKITSPSIKNSAKVMLAKKIVSDKFSSGSTANLLLSLYSKDPSYYDFYNSYVKSTDYAPTIDPELGLNFKRIHAAIEFASEYYDLKYTKEVVLDEDEYRTLVEKHFDEEIADYIDDVELLTEDEYRKLMEIKDIVEAYLTTYLELFQRNDKLSIDSNRLYKRNASGQGYITKDATYDSLQRYLPLMLNMSKDKLQFEHENLFKI